MSLSYHPQARDELIQAARFYEGRVPGLGDRFLREFDAAIAAISLSPTRWQVVRGEIRRYIMKRFPYGIYYRAVEDDLRILVVKHHSQHPDHGRDRLGP